MRIGYALKLLPSYANNHIAARQELAPRAPFALSCG
jgi:hypothetical protein